MTANLPTRKMHIAMVLDTFDDVRNGAVISTQRFTELLRRDGHRVTVISSGQPAPDKVVLPEFYPPFFKKVMQRMHFIFAWPDRKLLKAAFREADLVHIQFSFYLGIRAIGIARALGKPVVATFHVQAEQLLYNVGLRQKWIVRLVYWLFLRSFYNRVDLVICPSRFAEQELRRYGLHRPTAVISNGITPQYQAIKTDFQPFPGYFTLLSVGRNAAEKRQDMLIRALARCRNRDHIRLAIIGNGPQRDVLEQLGRELLDEGQVRFEYLPPAELIHWYNSADLYVHCAAVEVECMAATEAMACGLPLLIADAPLSAARQFALGPEHLFADENELAQKIDYWFEHPEALRQAREKYLQLAGEYRIDVSFEKLKSVYNGLLEQKKLFKTILPADVEPHTN